MNEWDSIVITGFLNKLANITSEEHHLVFVDENNTWKSLTAEQIREMLNTHIVAFKTYDEEVYKIAAGYEEIHGRDECGVPRFLTAENLFGSDYRCELSINENEESFIRFYNLKDVYKREIIIKDGKWLLHI